MIVQIAIAVVWVGLVLAAGAKLTVIGPWYRNLAKPGFKPPDRAFAPVWTTIGVLTGVGAILAWNAATPDQKQLELLLLAINSVLNIAWSALFFRLRRPDWALVGIVPLWISIADMIVAFGGHAPVAAALLVPYLGWVSVAAALNASIAKLNR